MMAGRCMRSIDYGEPGGRRCSMELEKASRIAEELKGELEGTCNAVEIVGEIRRRKPKIRRIKFLCMPTATEGTPIPELEPVDPEQWEYEIQEFGDHDALDEWFVAMLERGVVHLPAEESWKFTRTRRSIMHSPSGMPVDIFVTDEERWAVALVVATGGAATVRRLAAAARERGWRFRRSGNGFDTPCGHITCNTEQEVFEAVGLRYLPPEQRE